MPRKTLLNLSEGGRSQGGGELNKKPEGFLESEEKIKGKSHLFPATSGERINSGMGTT